ncbi:MAG TPA: tetratricopeptide repeat protein [Candidatus Eremiobacteraceae bacterium]|nr:tetratricopeptide repeat protein [Candidatus Eremiobacteraceae bacterium]
MRVVTLLGVLVFCAGAAYADKIVLKNGRQIVAFNVVEDGDKVRYSTSAGELSIPKSIVDHIERGGLMPVMENPATAAANLNIAPPPIEATADAAAIDQAAVHDGSIDHEYIARMEADARSGNAKANQKAALAHHAAAQFELARGDLEHALGDERTAITFLPEQPVLLMNVAYLYLKKSEFKQAVEYLERAKRVSADNAEIYKLEGWAYYGMNRPDQAISEWKKALALKPDPETQAALDKALRDKQEEDNYRENESAHFQLKYNGAEQPALAREVLRTLEAHYAAIESELNYTPPEPIGVVLYTQQAFADITRAPGWVGALNDGRIRVPVQGLTSMDSELSRVLKHELTHSFIQQKTRGRAPTWIQEGVAQWMEGKRSDENAAVLVQVHDAGQFAPLGRLEGSWMGLPGDVARYAYAWALANVEYIVETDGMGDMERILDRLAEGGSTESALKEVLHDDYGDLMQSTAEYLKKNYAR